MKKKKALFIILAVLLVVCLFPIRSVYKDGGTKDYRAVLYRVIVWHKISPNSGSNQTEYLTGTKVYLFPFNFGEKAWSE